MPVESFTLTRRELFAGGQSFSDTGPYEIIDGTLHYAVDPQHVANARIVDLALAPRDADGKVRFHGQLSLLVPLHEARANGRLLLDVPNRGRRLSISSFNRIPRALADADPLLPGDGFLFRRGYALATVGWQFDIPDGGGFTLRVPNATKDGTVSGAPIRGEVIVEMRANRDCTTLLAGSLGAPAYRPADPHDPGARLYRSNGELIPRADWQFARDSRAGVTPSGEHVYCRTGFRAGELVTLVFTAEGAPVVGCGLLAIRDAALWLRGPDTPLRPRPRWVYGFGVSQTGRFLRQFLWDGLNRGEAGHAAPVFDALLIHIAGGQRGDFNHRFAQPSEAGAASFGQRFPFAAARTTDAETGESAALLERCDATASTPKIFITNTSWEYWRGDASLAHLTPDGRDAPAHPSVRLYAYAGAQHIGAQFPPTNGHLMFGKARYPFSVVDHSPLQRAALLALDAWTSESVEPPASAVPTVAGGGAVSRAQVLREFSRWAAWPVLEARLLPVFKRLDLPANGGVTTYPVRAGKAYVSLVSQVDADGNETAGIRLPDVSVPAGTHTGWNPRAESMGAPGEPMPFVGFTRFFAPDETTRAQQRDPRPSLAARYASRDVYRTLVRAAAQQLVEGRYLLAEDVGLTVQNALERYDHARGERSAS